MNPGRYFTPGMRSLGNVARMGNVGMRMSPFLANNYLPSRSVGFFGRIGNSLRSFNWANFLNGTSKTLNVVNQAIPLVRQAKPMFNNIRSMVHLAKAFGNETNFRDNKLQVNNHKIISATNKNNEESNNHLVNNNSAILNSNYPNFFI